MENSIEAKVEFDSTKKNTGKRPGKASKQKHQDAFRERKGTAELKKIHDAAAKRTYCDLDLEEGLELLAKLHISQSRTEAQVPVSTRAAGFLTAQTFTEAEAVATRAVNNTGITPPNLYRVTLSQIAVQQHIGATKSVDLQDSEIAPHQAERIPVDVAQEVLTTKKTFSVLAHVVNSYGLLKHGARTYRSFVPPHPEIEVPDPRRIDDGAHQVAVVRNRIMPNPYRVTIQTLRDTVLTLSDPLVPQDLRNFFRMNNPIPGAVWDGDLLVNPDELCAPDYFNSDMFYRDIDVFRRFMSSIGSKHKIAQSECHFDGMASINMLVSASQQQNCRVDGLFVRFPRDMTFRTQFELSDQQMMSGILSMVGENEGTSFRDPTVMTNRIDVSWPALIRDILAKE